MTDLCKMTVRSLQHDSETTGNTTVRPLTDDSNITTIPYFMYKYKNMRRIYAPKYI